MNLHSDIFVGSQDMLRIKYFLVVIFLVGSVQLHARDRKPLREVKNLRADWLIFRGTEYLPYDHQQVNTIYFNVDAQSWPGGYICLHSSRSFDIFINRKLVGYNNRDTIVLSIDSLARIFSQSLSVGIYQKERIEWFYSSVVMPASMVATAPVDPIARHQNFFLNFLVIAVLILTCYFVLLFRTNPKLTLDYLNVSKLLSVQEQRENLLATRVTASVNLLFYLFCAAFCGLGLLIIFYYGADQVWVAHYFPVRTTLEGFVQWIKLIVIIGGFLTLKLVGIFGFSIIFRLRDTAALQFFNFIRMLFFITTLLSVILLAYFIYYGYPAGPHIGLLKTALVVMAFSVLMIFLKLLSSAPFSFFHLFSYLCASEIIPLVILLKVLLY
jgi:Domain of unknown function (DUF4271)